MPRFVSQHVRVEIVPGRLRMFRGRDAEGVPCAEILLEPTPDASSWIRSIRAAGAPLSEQVEKLGLNGAVAHVVCRSMTSVLELQSLAVRSSGQAMDAAALAIADSAAYSLDLATVATDLVGRDGRGEPRQFHVIVAAERDDTASAIVEILERADLKVDSIEPMDAPVLKSLVLDALAIRDGVSGLL
jgi:hypothetical protein